MNKYLKNSVLSIAASLVLVACGGGGSSSDDNNGGDGGDDTPQTSLSGNAIDGYLVGSQVCLDLNLNDACDSDEPQTISGDEGDFNLTINDTTRAHTNFAKAPILVLGGVDTDNPSKEFSGVLKAPNNGTSTAVVTPLTTLVAAYMKNNDSTDVATAQEKIASKLGLEKDDLNLDPIKSQNAKLVEATQIIQQTINTFKTVADETNTDIELDDIVNTLVAKIDEVDGESTEDTINQLVEKADFEDTSLKNAKALVKKNVENVAEVFDGKTTISEDEIKTLNQSVLASEYLVQRQIRQDADTLRTASTYSADNLDLEISESELADIQREAILFDKGVDTTAENFNIDNFSDLDISFDTDLEVLSEQMGRFAQNNPTLINQEIINQIEAEKQSLEDTQSTVTNNIAQQEGEEASKDLRETVNNLLSPTQTASVSDAKVMFTQLREFANTLYDDNNEYNTSTLLGSHNKMITDHLEPAIETIGDSFGESTDKLDASIEAFNDSLDGAFESQFNAIEARLDAIEAEMEKYDEDENWNAETIERDTIAHTYSKTGDLVTETFTLNGTTITSTWKDTMEDDGTDSLSTSGTISLTGTGYNLQVSELSVGNNKASFKASGTIESDSNSMELSELSLSFDFEEENDDSPHFFNNVEAKFDGSISINSRTLEGSLTLSEETGTHTLIGKYADGDINFDGTITANIASDDIKDMIDDEDKSIDYLWAGLYSVEYEDGSQSFVKGFTSHYDVNSTWDDETETETITQSRDFFDLDGNEFTCTRTTTKTYYDEYKTRTRTATCNNNVKTLTSYEVHNQVVTVIIDGQEYFMNSAWYTNYNYHTHQNEPYNFVYLDLYNYDGDAQDYWGSYKLGDLNITAINTRDLQSIDDIQADMSFDGTLKDDTNEITAKVGIRQDADDTLNRIYAEDISIKNGTDNFITLASLNMSTQKEQNNDSWVWHKEFQSFTETKYYYSDENDDELNSIKIENLNGQIVDNENTKMEVSANFESSVDSNDKVTMEFTGTYSYGDTTFEGTASGSGADNGDGAISFDISGKISSNGFEPFSLTAAGFDSEEKVEAYGLFTRGENDAYKLGISIEGDNNITTVQMADSNGVLGTATFKEDEEDPETYTITNKDDDTLATFGESENGNDWEVEYSDNTTETIF